MNAILKFIIYFLFILFTTQAYHQISVQSPMDHVTCHVDTSLIPSFEVSPQYSPAASAANLQCGKAASCFIMRADTAIANGAPFERRSEIGCEECLKFCLDKRPGTGSYQCLSVVYDYMRSVCDLYAVHGNSFPQCLASLRGYSYFKPSESCVLTTEVSTFECEGSTLPKLILLQNYVSTTIPFYDLSGHSEAECLTACKENRDKYGSPLKLGDLKCQTAQFSSRRMCQLSSQPIDLYNLEENSGSKLYSIRCYANLPPCSKPFRFVPQYVLVGYARQVADAVDDDECVQLCLSTGMFRCKSAMFFKDDKIQNCILNSESASTRPDLFVPEDEYYVYYYQVDCAENGASFKQRATWNGYQSFVKALKDYPELSGWTEWSPCCSATNLQYRYERCSEKDVRHCNKQTRKCKIAT
ncbi:Uncharacterized protein T05_14986 [Trichinella murrelli]|uniref:Apple domain-containing protein n=1 Tax=Trichinella murrelli TaxID=144512 RepID=A0A0V0UGN9_9BILA|nr:Uncharacterized protein T05_14986 [Trichinella murrelli]